MALKITKASEPIQVEHLVVTVYSPPGLGKSTLGFTAASPLLLDFDGGAYRAGNRGDVVQVRAWADVAGINQADLSGYQTVVVDTAGRALDALTADIITGNAKLGRGGALTLQGYGELKARFTAWTKLIRSFGLDVLLLAHADEQRQGDDIIERLDVQGGSKNEIYKVSDCMGRLAIKGGKRVLNFSPTDTSFGKNPAQLPELEVPHFSTAPHFLADVIGQIKDALNQETLAQREAAQALAAWQKRCASLSISSNLKDWNALIHDATQADPAVKHMILAAGKKAGLVFDKKAKEFSVPAQEEA